MNKNLTLRPFKSPQKVDYLPIAEPFLSCIHYFGDNMGNDYFYDYIKKQAGCQVNHYLNTLNRGYKIFSAAGPIYEVVDRETNTIQGYTTPQLVELSQIIKFYKENEEKVRIMEVKEKINPVNFKESNKTLRGGQDADDLRVFNDGEQSVSCWKLTFFGALKLLFTRKIWLGVLAGNSQPPVWISVDFPFKTK